MKRKKIDFNFFEYLEHNRKNIIINLIIFLSLLFILLLIDLLTKHYLFDWIDNFQGKNQINGYKYENALFGIRSVSNSGLWSFGNRIPIGLVHFANFLIIFIAIFFLLILKSKWFAVGISLVSSGTLGNMIDRFAFEGHVRDIIYLPWCDKGTFNFADVYAISGVFILSITLIVQIIRNYSYRD